ncbi:MAG: aminomethyl-transferring glycine dehydrogenase subunit GcvPA [Candidatus Tritonobacter lacicola]|nr:aminomethyl-transferring glycine dehydrogenase subunit GcvPA [Candidatus Tritonobacter lacicola]
MRYIPNTEEQKKEMLKEIGVSSFEDLIQCIPSQLRLNRKLHLPEPLAENELKEMIYRIAGENMDFSLSKALVGAGAYQHHVPEAEKALLQREEFYTAYTPYQPELSQGTLQSMFELQTYLARLTKMDVVIPSMYDGASATGEAALMSLRLTHRNKIMISSSLHPHYRDTVRTYTAPHETEILDLPHDNGLVDLHKLKAAIDEEVAAVIVQNPNFFGGIEKVADISELVHSAGALLIHVIAESMSLGVLQAPGELGADIVPGEAQSLGLDLNFGGPYNGYLAARKQLLRQLPGRIAGETVDKEGQRVFVMTLRTREQDIRREKATSNICTNHGLNIVASNIYLSLLGTEGFHKVSLLNTKAAHYLENLLIQSGNFETVFQYPFYNEFLLRSKMNISDVKEMLIENGFIPPLEISRFYRDKIYENVLLFAVTEIFSREDLDKIADLLSVGC